MSQKGKDTVHGSACDADFVFPVGLSRQIFRRNRKLRECADAPPANGVFTQNVILKIAYKIVHFVSY